MNAPASEDGPPADVGPVDTRGWTALLSLGFAADDGATRIARRHHRGPLVVQRAFFPEGPAVAHVYLLHPPGGMVAGDTLSVDVTVDAGAHALITTPAAGKAYRSGDQRQARLGQRLRVARGATLEWFPQETIVFDGAQVQLVTQIELEGDARFVGWEIVCLGRTAGGERLTHGFCQQHLELRRDGRPLVIDRTRLVGGGDLLAAPFGLGGQPVTGTMIIAPAVAATLEPIRALAAAVELPDRAAVTVVDGAMVCRYLGASGERARGYFAAAWSIVRPLLCDRPPCPPRIWMT
jgi:urease accessory protein